MRVDRIHLLEHFNPPSIEVTVQAGAGVTVLVRLEHKDYRLSELSDAAFTKAREALQKASDPNQ